MRSDKELRRAINLLAMAGNKRTENERVPLFIMAGIAWAQNAPEFPNEVRAIGTVDGILADLGGILDAETEVN